MLTIPLHRNFAFPLQHLCRAVITTRTTYDGINKLPLPKTLKSYLKEYHYKQRVRVRRLDTENDLQSDGRSISYLPLIWVCVFILNRAIVRCIINFPFASTVLSRYEDDARGTSRSLNGLNVNLNLNETVCYIFGSPFVFAAFFQLLLRCCRFLQRDLWLVAVAVACPLAHSHSLAIARRLQKKYVAGIEMFL